MFMRMSPVMFLFCFSPLLLRFAESEAAKGKALFLFLGRKQHVHLLAFHLGQLIYLAVGLQVGSQTQEQDFALILVDDGSTAEKDVRLDLGAFLQETDGVLLFELVVVFVGLRTEADLFQHHLGRVGLHGLLAFLLLVEELAVIHYAAHRRIGRRRYFHQIHAQIPGDAQGFVDGIDALFHILPYQPHLTGADPVIDVVLGSLGLYTAPERSFVVW